MKQLAATLLTILALGIEAQKIQYGGMQQACLHFGESGLTAAFSMINGIRIQKFFVGLGGDYKGGNNNWMSLTPKSMSGFVDGRYYVNTKKNVFAKLQGGITRVLPDNTGYEMNTGTGLYCSSGIGFKARLSDEVFYSFDVSYSLRQLKFETQQGQPWLSFPSTDRYNLIRPTIVVSMGIEIF